MRSPPVSPCSISATCELHIHAMDGRVGRQYDAETGLKLFRFEG